MSLKIATWNVNSIRQRIEHLQRLIAEEAPDVLCLQETKVRDEDFPAEPLRELGYDQQAIHGQKSYNGVAILSRRPFEALEPRVWCGLDDRRHLAVRLEGGIELHNFYVPSGGPEPDRERNPKFDHKLRFLTEMADWAAAGGLAGRRAVLVGDFNVAPLENDVWNHKKLLRSVGHTPMESAHIARALAAGSLIDLPRHFVPAPEPLYTWWGYRFPQSFEKNYGWRLDHVWTTPPTMPEAASIRILKDTRTWPQPSDHVPVVLTLA